MRTLLIISVSLVVCGISHGQFRKNQISFQVGYGINTGASDFENAQTLNEEKVEEFFSSGRSQGFVEYQDRLGGLGKGLFISMAYERYVLKNFTIICRPYYHDLIGDQYYDHYKHSGVTRISRMQFVSNSMGMMIGVGLYLDKKRSKPIAPFFKGYIDLSSTKTSKKISQPLVGEVYEIDYKRTGGIGYIMEFGVTTNLSRKWQFLGSLQFRALRVSPSEADFTYYSNGEEELSPGGYDKIVYGYPSETLDRSSRQLFAPKIILPMNSISLQVGVVRSF
ncbi:MAG: hypothetical protein RLP14_04590 [Owenweeksia sp.]